MARPALELRDLATFLPPLAPAIFLAVRLAGRIYDRSALRFGAPMKLRDALGLARGAGSA